MVQDAKGQTPLHIACLRGDLEAFKMIVNRGYQSLNCIDHQKKTPMDYAIDGKHTILIEQEKRTTVTLYSHKVGQSDHKLKPQDFELITRLGQGAFG